MDSSPLTPQVIALTGLAVEYCRLIASAADREPQEFVGETLRYLPRIYISIADLKPYGPDSDGEAEATGVITETVDEQHADDTAATIAALLGQYDSYLSAQSDDDMQFSESPVAMSLSQQLTDIFRDMADFASAVANVMPDDVPEVLADIKAMFAAYLSQTICSALTAANNIYQSKVLLQAE